MTVLCSRIDEREVKSNNYEKEVLRRNWFPLFFRAVAAQYLERETMNFESARNFAAALVVFPIRIIRRPPFFSGCAPNCQLNGLKLIAKLCGKFDDLCAIKTKRNTSRPRNSRVEMISFALLAEGTFKLAARVSSGENNSALIKISKRKRQTREEYAAPRSFAKHVRDRE